MGRGNIKKCLFFLWGFSLAFSGGGGGGFACLGFLGNRNTYIIPAYILVLVD